MKKKFGLLMLISTGILLGLTGCGAEKLDMNQFVTYEFVGYDGYGSVVSDFDDKEFISELVLLADPDKNIDESEAKDILGWDEPLYDELSAGEWIDNGSISNGDSTTFKWSMSDSYKKNIQEKTGVKLITDDYKVKVKGLKSSENFNINDYIDIGIKSDAPYATLKIKKSGKLKNWPKFKYSKKENLSNGDVIEITIGKTEEQFENFRKENGLPEFDQTFTYTVEGISTRITSIDQMDDELLSKLKDYSEAKMWDYSHSDYITECSIDSYAFATKEDENGEIHNLLLAVYKFKSSNLFIPDGYKVVVFIDANDSKHLYNESNEQPYVPKYDSWASYEDIKESFTTGEFSGYSELQIREIQ